MITSIDTSILLDVFLPDPTHGETSLMTLEKAYKDGALVICNIVYAELAPQFDDRVLLDRSLSKMGVEILPLDSEAAHLAGLMWKAYRKKAKTRDRIITDFLIGAFSKTQSDRLLTRDRGFYREYFKGLALL
ncbi:MAG: type II toxin-antitoxin system VapC family toxin [Spirochaetes bacterium]|nr:type II toxin-antitoxin system VapC family toxin [Spirochaetota bacterium]